MKKENSNSETYFKNIFHAQYVAKFGVIAVETPEEKWLTDVLQKYAEERAGQEDHAPKIQKMYCWDRANGWTVPNSRQKPDMKYRDISLENSPTVAVDHKSPRTKMLAHALEVVYGYFCDDETLSTCFVFYDVGEEISNATIARYLRAIAQTAKTESRSVLVLVQQKITLPPELEEFVSVTDFIHPTSKHFEKILNTIIEKNANRVTCELGENEKRIFCDALKGFSRQEGSTIMVESILRNGSKINDDLLGLINKKKKETIRKSGLLSSIEVDEKLEDIGGLAHLKSYLLECKQAFLPAARKYGIRSPRGFLTIGPPGAGKTMVAKATASVLELPLIRFDISAVFNMYVGSSEKNMGIVQKKLEQYAPCVVLMDEIDKAIAGLKGGGGDSGVGSRILGALLSFMNDTEAPIFFVGTSNSIDLPPEILRKGRWDELFFVDLPSLSERREIFRIHLARVKRDLKNFKVNEIARKTAGFSGAEIANVVQQALRKGFVEGATDIETSHILAAIAETKPLSQTRADEIGLLRDFARKNTRMASSETDTVNVSITDKSSWDLGDAFKPDITEQS